MLPKDMEIFLSNLIPENGMWFHIWRLKDKTTLWFTELDSVSDYFNEEGDLGDHYIGPGLSHIQRSSKERIRNADADGILGFVSDIDYGSIHSKHQRLPKTKGDAKKIIDRIPLQVRPTFEVASGHGYQLWWVFEEPWVFDSDKERVDALELSRGWGRFIRNEANELGYTIDTVTDLARVMRLPGTINLKDPNFPVSVRLINNSELLYSPQEFEMFIPDKDESQPDPVVGVELVLDMNAKLPEKWKLYSSSWPRASRVYSHEEEMDSMSEYDMSLAIMGAEINLTAQEICDLLVNHRVKWEGFEGKTLREDYYKRTVAKAFAVHRSREEEEEAESAIAEISVIQTQNVPEEQSEEKLRHLASTSFGVEIGSVIKYLGDEPEYVIEINGKLVSVGGVNGILNQAKLREKIADSTLKIPRKIDSANYQIVSQALLDLVEIRDPGAEATQTGLVLGWLHEYVDTQTPSREIIQGVSANLPVIYEGHICIHIKSFTRWIKGAIGGSKDSMPKGMPKTMLKIGAEYVEAKKDGKTRSLWKLPLDRFPLPEDDYEY